MKKNYFFLVSAIIASVFAGCDIEKIDKDSSWDIEGSAHTDTTFVNDTVRDTTIIVDSLLLSSSPYETIDDSMVTYELVVKNGETTLGSFELQRLSGVLNGSKKEVLVKSENKLQGVHFEAGNFSSDSTTWKSGSYWSGENVNGHVSFTMANDSVSANFVDTYYSSSAVLAKDTMSINFPALSWTHSSVLDSTSVYNKSNGDSLFKVKDFITTTTFVAEVNPDFVKEGSVSKKSFEVKDTLSLMFFVEPDPEDAVIDTVAYGSVEKMNGVIYGIGRWYERHTLLDSVLVKEQKQAFNATLTAENGEAVYASDANYQTIGNGWTGNGNTSYVNDAINDAHEPFANTYSVVADKGMTMSFGGIDVVFTTEMVITEAGQTIGASELVKINDVHYDVYPYANKVNGVYTVSCGNEKQSVEMSATTNREIRVKAADQLTEAVENQSFYAQFKTEGSVLSTIKYGNAWDYTTYNFGVEANRESFEHNMTVSAEITGASDFDVQDKSDLSKEYKITSISETANESEKVEENGFRFERETRFFDVTVNNGQTLKVKVITEKDLTPDVNLGYMSLVDVKDGGVNPEVNGNEVTLKPTVKILLEEKSSTNSSKAPMRGAAAPAAPKAYTISTEMVGKYTPQVDTVRVPKMKNNVPTVETYRVVDGDSTLIETESYNPYCSLTANNGNDVIAENYNFATTFNGVSNESVKSIQDNHFFITRVSGDVKSTMSNGTHSADNEGKYTFDKVIAYQNGSDIFTFDGEVSFTISTDDITAAGDKMVNNMPYSAYAYKTTFNMVYKVKNAQVAEKSASVERNILIEKEIEDLVPGTILSVAITAVPAHAVTGGFADGSGQQQAIKGLAIVTTDGKATFIPFAGADDTNAMMPAKESISGANYVAGGYDASYNSGYYTASGWMPAVMTENGTQIFYKVAGKTVRSLTQKSMSTWSWRNGNYSATVGGYTFSINSGVATVKYNEVIVSQFK